jgi:polysaccharide biosynthesis protein PslH
MVKSMHNAGVEITLMSFNTAKHWVNTESLGDKLPFYKSILTVPLDNRLSFFQLIRNIFLQRSYHIERFESVGFRSALIKLLEEETFDIIQLESLYLCPYIDLIRKQSDAKIVLRSHNVEWLIWNRIAANEPNFIRRRYLKYASAMLRKYEKKAIASVDALITISKDDENLFRGMGFGGSAYYYPIVLDVASFSFSKPQKNSNPVIHFIGSLDWIPNQQGICWFVKECWPLILRQWPDAVLRIAGRNMPEHMQSMGSKSIEILGEIEDASAYVSAAPFALVPLLAGSGMRAKIIEAMALGRIILSTSIGIEGIPAVHGKHFYRADKPQEFVDAIRHCLNNQDESEAISVAARNFAITHFDAAELTKGLLMFYKEQILE